MRDTPPRFSPSGLISFMLTRRRRDGRCSSCSGRCRRRSGRCRGGARRRRRSGRGAYARRLTTLFVVAVRTVGFAVAALDVADGGQSIAALEVDVAAAVGFRHRNGRNVYGCKEARKT